MSRPKLMIYSQGLSDCPCSQDINNRFKAEWAYTNKQFLSRIKSHNPDAAVVCFCSCRKEDAEELLLLDAITGSLPLLTCSRNLTLDFIIAAAELGANRFLCCEWKMTKIETVIRDAIQFGGLREFLAIRYPNSLSASQYTCKIVNEIVQAFPQRLQESEVAETLGISPRWLRTVCCRSFGKSFTQLMRQIRVYQALRFMKQTTLDNWDIAMQLNYSEESNMARDFRKELGYCPSEARMLLSKITPQKLLL